MAAQDAAWEFAFEGEAAILAGQHSAAVLLDAQKAFASIPLDALACSAVAEGFPRAIAMCAISMYAGKRHIKVARAVAEAPCPS
eukprot:672279-Lingulodinium_polyedra.AAC.1